MKLSAKEMSAFLMYRVITPETLRNVEKCFPERYPISSSDELEEYLNASLRRVQGKRYALALSGGIDSAILAKILPEGTKSYTFKCVVPGIEVTDETPIASRYARECGLDNEVIEVFWDDFENYAPILMCAKGAPIHSIEVQIYKAAIKAKEDGIDILIFGEAADAIYGGQSNILSREWTIGEFIERYSYVMPYKVLREFELPIEAITRWEHHGVIDPYTFMSHEYIQESVGSYLNAVKTAGIEYKLPYAETKLNGKIDYSRIRAGENKYIVRDLFKKLYPNFEVPQKIPMPRPMNEWLKDWKGPKRKEFWDNCGLHLNGDQKWILWSLEQYLNL